MAKKALGKGLDIIFGDGLEQTIKDIEAIQEDSSIKVEEIEINKIEVNPYQPRRHFDKEKLNELASSISKNGLLTPIVVKETKGNKFYIVAGERRYRAHKIAKLNKIRAIIIDVSDKKMAELALIENIQREDLNPIEEAYAIKQLMKTRNLTQETVSKTLGKSRSYVANLLNLLKLPKKIIDGVLSGKTTYSHVKPLVALEEDVAISFYDLIVKESWTVRDVENKTRAYKLREAKKNKPKIKVKIDENIEYVKDLIRAKIQTPVKIEKKKIIIKYKDDEHLNRILKRLDLIK